MRRERVPQSLVWIAALLSAGPVLVFLSAGFVHSEVLALLAMAAAMTLALPGRFLLAPIWWHGGPGVSIYVIVLILVNFCFYYGVLRLMYWWNTWSKFHDASARNERDER